MKRYIITASAVLLMAVASMAEELRVADVTVPQATSLGSPAAWIEIELINPSSVYDSFFFQLQLPDGIVAVMADDGYPLSDLGSRFSGGVLTGNKAGNIATYARLTDGTVITGSDGVLLRPQIQALEGLPVGTVLEATISDITFTTPQLTKEKLAPVTFNITIGEPDPATAIHAASSDGSTPVTAVHDLAGRKLAKPVQKGVYVIGSRKVVVK